MKVTIETSSCSGHARCAAAAPQLFRLDDDGYALPFDGDIPQGLEQAARDGERACPERAITVR
ncbi:MULTISPECIES: ferredoxin [unclassified Streptomyces]|jgi:ferredoxin|uniref:ferredoxin n=1 Tax=unclassified Streptomyces TaxID=2593676 RepID=UPI00224FE5A7|nr:MULTISPECIES: ferredoxin [unclassified Streptomyces]MCX4404691.1 ferredoxin [Streptomyces sp. NBC_01764]MCX5095653.1 ferredoxin [Streptomyces sp. NBC_00365]MCX5190763.1 ferredoxin [Streptomyces sp. NBC_00268]